MSILKIVSIADIHVGATFLDAWHLLKNLQTYLYPQLKDCDVFVIAGDLFDTKISMNLDASLVIYMFANEIMELSKEHNFAVRVVEGTFLHDRHQNKLFNSYKDFDVKVYDDVTLDKVNGLDMLFIPDSLKYKNIVETGKKLMDNMLLDKVDFIFGHGMLDYAVPFGAKIPKDELLDHIKLTNMVSGAAIFGHVHSASACKKACYLGSFERLCHGEEEPKGFSVFKYDTDSKRVVSKEFIENKTTNIFKTIIITETDPDIVLRRIKDCIQFYSEFAHRRQVGCHIKAKVANEGLRYSAIDYVKTLDTKCRVHFRCEKPKGALVDIEVSNEFKMDANLVKLTSENLPYKLEDHIALNKLGELKAERITEMFKQVG